MNPCIKIYMKMQNKKNESTINYNLRALNPENLFPKNLLKNEKLIFKNEYN